MVASKYGVSQRCPAELLDHDAVRALLDRVEVVDHLIPMGQPTVCPHGKAEELFGTWDLGGQLGARRKDQRDSQGKQHEPGARMSPAHNSVSIS